MWPVWSSACRQRDHKACTAARTVLDGDAAVVAGDDVVDDRESEPGAPGAAGSGFVESCETFEHVGSPFWRDAGAVVGDDQGRLGAALGELDVDGRVWRGGRRCRSGCARRGGARRRSPTDLGGRNPAGVDGDRRAAAALGSLRARCRRGRPAQIAGWACRRRCGRAARRSSIICCSPTISSSWLRRVAAASAPPDRAHRLRARHASASAACAARGTRRRRTAAGVGPIVRAVRASRSS